MVWLQEELWGCSNPNQTERSCLLGLKQILEEPQRERERDIHPTVALVKEKTLWMPGFAIHGFW